MIFREIVKGVKKKREEKRITFYIINVWCSMQRKGLMRMLMVMTVLALQVHAADIGAT